MDASNTESVSWFYETDGQRKGPIIEDGMLALIKQGAVTYGTLVWKAGFPEWLKVEDSELRIHLERVAPPPITGRHIGNGVVWTLAFAPLIGYILESAFAYAISSATLCTGSEALTASTKGRSPTRPTGSKSFTES